MEQREQEFVDAEAEGYTEFDERGIGSFHFGYVHGDRDCQPTKRDGVPALEWPWDGNDEMHATQGRGWAVLNNDELSGMIFLHCGDSLEFVVKK